MPLSDIVKELVQREISNLEDDAYRYRHIGRGEGDILVAEKRERRAAQLKEVTNGRSVSGT